MSGTLPREGLLPGPGWVLLGAILWSTGGVCVKWLPSGGLAIAGARSLFSALFFIALLGGRVLPRGSWSTLLAGATSYAAVVIGFVLATKHTSAANAIILQYTAPLWIAVLAWPMLRERPRPGDWLALLIGFPGVLLCMWDGLRADAGGSTATGDLIALGSGVAFALLTLVLRGTARGSSDSRETLVVLAWGNALAALIGAPAIIGEAQRGAFDHTTAALLLWLGIGQLGCGYLAFQRGLRSTPALRASILSLIEPVLNPIWVALVVGEVPTGKTVAGGALVLAAMGLNAALSPALRREPAPAP